MNGTVIVNTSELSTSQITNCLNDVDWKTIVLLVPHNARLQVYVDVCRFIRKDIRTVQIDSAEHTFQILDGYLQHAQIRDAYYYGTHDPPASFGFQTFTYETSENDTDESDTESDSEQEVYIQKRTKERPTMVSNLMSAAIQTMLTPRSCERHSK